MNSVSQWVKPASLCLRTFLHLVVLTFSLLLVAQNSAAEKNHLTVEAVEAYIELRTSPGKSYPVFYVIQRGENVDILKRRNEWFKVTLVTNGNRVKQGWVHRRDIAKMIIALEDDDERQADELQEPTFAHNHPRLLSTYDPKWYMGFGYGQFSNSDLLEAYVGYRITDSFAIEAATGEFIGANADGKIWSVATNFSPFPHWKVSPYGAIARGGIDAGARGANSSQNDGSDKFFHVATGIHVLLASRYRLRLEYRHINILTDSDNNEELETWHIGFTASF